jgi:hypothetical protein
MIRRHLEAKLFGEELQRPILIAHGDAGKLDGPDHDCLLSRL